MKAPIVLPPVSISPERPLLRVAVIAFGFTFYEDELSKQAWDDLVELVRRSNIRKRTE